MKLTRTTLLALAGTIALATVQAPTAQAANINTMATECRNNNGPDPQPLAAVGVNNTTNAPMAVLCSIPRSPLTPPSAGLFFIDGKNPRSGTTTTCAVAIVDFTGNFITSVGQSSSALTYDLLIEVNAAQLPMFAYTDVVCILPPGGTLIGMTSVQ